MKKFILFFLFVFSISYSQDSKISKNDLINVKWKMKRYITDGLSMPIERSRRKDYQIFMPNNKREEMQFGKKYENLHWEFLPFGQFIMMYSEKMDIYIPARITELKKNEELRLTIFDINTSKLITIIYEAN
tara:strand:- start:537 stop:929 length:393 start_codon:yes stop_codon:yes gene_type:complete